jgi:hypothetical protein
MILIAQVCFGLPLFLLFLSRAHSEGTLTLARGARLLLIWATGATLLAVAMWFTFFLPLMRRRQASTDVSRSNNRWRGP